MKITKVGENLNHHITINARALMMFNHVLYSKYNEEFTAFTHCDRDKSTGEYRIYDVFFPIQENTGVKTDVEGEDLIDLMQDGADITKLTGHIHSHVNMGVNPSSTDLSEILARAEHSNFNAALIINKKDEMFGHIVDLDLGLHIEDVDIFIEYPEDFDFEGLIMAQIKEASALDEVRDLANTDQWTMYTEMYPLTDVEKEYVETCVRTRFKKPVYNNANYKKTSTYNKKKVDELEFDIKTTDELPFDNTLFKSSDDYVDHLLTKNISEMTENEFRDYCLYFEDVNTYEQYMESGFRY